MSWFGIRRIRKLGHDDSGSIAVEFALVAPILLFALAGVVDIGSATYVKLALDARLTAIAEYALLQPAPGDQEAAAAMAEKLAGLMQGDATDTGEVIVNNGASAQWTGSAVTVTSLPGNAAMCYCPTLSDDDIAWGSAVDCGTSCVSGSSAGQFVRISATAPHVAIFPGYAFIDGGAVKASAVLRLQ